MLQKIKLLDFKQKLNYVYLSPAGVWVVGLVGAIPHHQDTLSNLVEEPEIAIIHISPRSEISCTILTSCET